jgi:hypothetical protein
MTPDKSTPRSFWLSLIVLTLFLSLWAAWSTYMRSGEAGIILQRSIWGGMLLVYALVFLVCVWLFIHGMRFGSRPFPLPDFLDNIRGNSLGRLFGLFVFLVLLFLVPYLKFKFQIGQTVKHPLYAFDPGMLVILYYWLCWWVLLLAGVSLKTAFQTSWLGGFAAALVILGVAFEIAARFNAVTTYPLSMGWSEGSRYYYASLYFSDQIYGESFPLSTLHPTRYFLQSIPFLFQSLGLPAHRFWQFLLWIVLTAAAALALSKRVVRPEEKSFRWLLAGWTFLFLLRVGVYYHLHVMTILPLVFVSPRHPWRSLFAVIAASLWAGVSRVNWFPVPAMIAVAIYLLEVPLGSSKSILHYLSMPVLWVVVGLASALAAQAAYIPLSGNASNVDAFASSFSSDLLWNRLWPNESYSFGVLPAILIVSGPLLLVLIVAAVRHRNVLHPLRWLGLWSMLLVLFGGSLVVSTKIGGGGDLHNMDAYAVLLVVIAGYFVGGTVVPEHEKPTIAVRPAPVAVYALVMPLFFLIPLLSPYPRFKEAAIQSAYNQLVEVVNQAGAHGPVLFINERQLVTFGGVDVPLVPQYEVVTLMEMAMSDNRPYLEQFYSDLASHRFAAIVATKQNLALKETGPLAEENNVWNSRISPYILCYYGQLLRVEAEITNLEVYVPEQEVRDCPGPVSQ